MYFNKETYHQLLDTFLPSEEMRAYLKTQPMESEHTILELIMGAPVPLSTKIRWSWGRDRRRAAEALAELRLRSGELLTLTEAWYDDDIREAKYWFNAPYLSFENAIADIRADLAECDEDGAEWLWYVLEKWVPGEKQELKLTYKYWLIGDQVMYFVKEDDHFSICRLDPNLPVPFQAGDLLTIDCRPFAPIKHALLLERGDNIDCCCLQGLCRDEKTGLWKTGWTCQEKCSRETPEVWNWMKFETERSVAEWSFKFRRLLMRPAPAAFCERPPAASRPDCSCRLEAGCSK